MWRNDPAAAARLLNAEHGPQDMMFGEVSPKTSGWLVCDLVDGGQYPKVGEEKANEEIS